MAEDIVNKNDLIAKITIDTQLPKGKVKEVLDSFRDNVIDCMKEKNKLVWIGFFSAQVVTRKATTAVNPQTGQVINVPSKDVVKLKASKKLLD